MCSFTCMPRPCFLFGENTLFLRERTPSKIAASNTISGIACSINKRSSSKDSINLCLDELLRAVAEDDIHDVVEPLVALQRNTIDDLSG